MNSYFATVEQQANPKLRGRPIAVLGSTTKRSIIVAASIEAKRLGVKTAMRIDEAIGLCPELVLVTGEPRKYSWVTKQFIHIFEDYTDKVEIFSIDEAFLDVTQTAHLYKSRNNKKCHSECNEESRFFASLEDDTSVDFEGAVNIAKEIKKRIREEIGSWISCSAGVSYNKFLAKTGSDLQKPDGLVVIVPNDNYSSSERSESKSENSSRLCSNNKSLCHCHPEGVSRVEGSPRFGRDDIKVLTVDEVLLNLPLDEFCGIGRQTNKRLRGLGIVDTQKLRDFSSTLLNKEFGIATGQKLKRMANGLDNAPVQSWREQAPAKSFSCSRTMNRDVYKRAEIEKQILFLLEKVAKKMRDDGYWAKEVGLWLRFKDFTGVGKSARIGKWTCDSLEMNQEVLKILKNLNIKSPVRAIGVYAGQVQLAKNVPQSMMPEDKVNEKILAAMDAVNNRFGEDSVTRARLAGTKLKEVVSGMGRKKF